MALERKDIRAYVDVDVHEALTAICNRRDISVADFIESLLVPEVLRIGHEAIELGDKLRDIGIFRKNPDVTGGPRK